MRSAFRKKDPWPNEDARRAFADAIADEVARNLSRESAPTWESFAWAAFAAGGAAFFTKKARTSSADSHQDAPPKRQPEWWENDYEGPAAKPRPDPDLVALGLPGLSIPSPEEIRTAYRAEMLRVHPDRGGSNAAAARVAAAYARLRDRGLVPN